MTACRVVDETIRGTDIVYGSLNLRIPFAGDHMIKNALTAVTAVRECGLNVSGEAIEQGNEKRRDARANGAYRRKYYS